MCSCSLASLQVYLVSLVELTANLLGVPVADLDSPSLGSIQSMVRTATNPNEQVQEIGAALNTMAGNRANLEVGEEVSAQPHGSGLDDTMILCAVLPTIFSAACSFVLCYLCVGVATCSASAHKVFQAEELLCWHSGCVVNQWMTC